VAESHGLSLPQYSVLRILRAAGDAGLATLTIRERMAEVGSGISRILKKLERAGFIHRDRSSLDRRSVVCRLTERGADLLIELDSPIVEANEAALKILSDADVDQLQRLLDLIHSRWKGAPNQTRLAG
jgi:DNA-binding MarR family transcriptional regulator